MIYAGVGLVAAATLILQVVLTRIFSVVQWHHFAFMAVGLGLLGYGASGTALAVLPGLRRTPLRTAAWAASAVAPATALALTAIMAVPFDAYLMTLEPVQFGYLTAQVTALILPFLCGGLAVGSLLSGFPESAGPLYAASFLGAGAGALASVPLLSFINGPQAVVGSAAIATAGAALLWRAAPARAGAARVIPVALAVALAAIAAFIPIDLPLSPYKALSQLRRYPDARVVFSRWNAISRVDVVQSRAVRTAPGLSVMFSGVPPSLPALTVDGDGLRGLPAAVDGTFTRYLPGAVAYRLRRGSVLVLGMGVDVLGAVHHRMPSVTVIEGNPLVVEAARSVGVMTSERPRSAPGLLATSGTDVRVLVGNPRIYLRRAERRFDLIQIPPQESFHVVASGAFSLSEQFLYTVEAFRDGLRALTPGGILSVTRWIQTLPSEEIRAWAAVVEALEDLRAGPPRGTQPAIDPASCLIAVRSLNALTILVKPDGFAEAEVAAVRAFAESRRFDITYGPGVDARESNRFNVLPADLHREAFLAVLDPSRRRAFLDAYPFNVLPSRDGRPFFFHFFRWQQVPQIVAAMGRTWQPFGGGGYLMLLALLLIAVTLSAGLILAPLRTMGSGRQPARPLERRWPVFAYFLALGCGYLLVEIPLLQQVILLLGSPTHAMAVVVCGLLVASGVGSLLVPRCARWVPALILLLAVGTLGVAFTLTSIIDASLGFPSAGRLAVLAAIILPLGVVMGMPFAFGIRILGGADPSLVPWAWGVNGCASVVASIAAALLALEWGFSAVLLVGAAAYAGAGVAIRLFPSR